MTGTQLEAKYRAVQMDSSSSLKEFSLDRKKYYKKYIVNERVEEADNKAATIGRIVETLLLEREEFDNRFCLSVCLSAPTGLMLAFVEALYKYSSLATDEDGNITKDFAEVCKDAYVESGFKIKIEAVLGKFIGSDAEIYYKELREVRSKGLTIVTVQDVDNAERIVNELKTNFVTSKVVNLVSSANYDVLNQFQIEGYSFDGHLFKSMIDKVVIDHEAKTIQVYDLKCTWSVENFYEEYYLYRRSYIQAFLYYRACFSILEAKNLTGYEVKYPIFIVCDSTNYFNPLMYALSQEDIFDCIQGFEYKGRNYPGVSSIISDLKWAIENNVWNINKTNYLSQGVVKLKKWN